MDLLILLVEPYKKSLLILSILSHKWLGRAAPCVTWFGMTDITNTALPAKDRNFVFQPASFFMTRLAMKLNWPLKAPLWFRGNPRYFQKLLVSNIPNLSHTLSFNSSPTFREKYILDFSQLIFWPNSIQKTRNTSGIASQISSLTLAKRMRSSAKNRWEIFKSPLEALRGHHKPLEHFSSIRLPKYSIIGWFLIIPRLTLISIGTALANLWNFSFVLVI